MSKWTKLPPIPASVIGCLNCGALYDIAPMDMSIAVGFGDARVTRDDETVYSEPTEWEEEDIWTVQDAENAATKDPEHDWRIVLYGPLYGKVFQRQEPMKWYLVEENRGFA